MATKKTLKYPENKIIAAKIKYGDRQRIAFESGYSISYLRGHVFSGKEKMPMKVFEVIKKILQEYNDFESEIKQLAQN